MNKQAEKLFNQDEKQKAVHVLVQAINNEPEQIENYLQLSTYLTQLQDVEQAEVLLQKAIGKFGAQTELLYNLGVVYYEAGRYDLAQTEFDKLNQQDANFDNNLMLARIFFKTKQYAKAAAFALTATEKAPQNSAAYLVLADSLLSLGQLSQAKTFYQKAYQLKPTDLDALFGIGLIDFVRDHDQTKLLAVKAKDAQYYASKQTQLVAIEKMIRDQKDKR
ncbi:tetratricopeptide repeat protein [Agrilactobacillus fermenti]|uniref:tetratricopeptide repeat protein n=1 Tax=Agrilactobacillus fermenti TaxID=2586909 RepID=UPI003A5B9CC3